MINDILTCIAGLSGGSIDRVALWTFGLVIVTMFLWLIARKQLGGINKTAKADFIKKFTDGFFSAETRELLMLFDYNALHFRSVNIELGEDNPAKRFPYFAINEDIVKQLPITPETQKKILDKKCFTCYEIDDRLLGHFEDLGSYERKKLIDIEGVYDGFDWYIDLIWNNDEIQKYVNSQRDDEKDGDDLYEDFKYIYNKCDSYGKAKAAGKCLLWWELKWRIKRIICEK